MTALPILVVGGGVAGLTAALEAAEAGHPAILVERLPYLGGRVTQLHKYFPKLCPPSCGLEMFFRRLRTNGKVQVFTLAEIEEVSGQPGEWQVTLRLNPQLVREERCTACGECARVCPVDRPNAFNYGLDRTRAIYLPHPMALPFKYVIDPSVCPGAACARCLPACPHEAIDLEMKPSLLRLRAASLVLATGWQPYDASRLDNLGFGRYGNVITNVMMERLAAPDGPTQGRIVRPTDGREPRTVAFVQCAGSRDENHLPYCSAVCCLVSLKQALYVREQLPAARVYIFYIDIRTPGRYEAFYSRVKSDPQVAFIRGKAARVDEDPRFKDLIVAAEDTLSGNRVRVSADMVVLATGMVPTGLDGGLAGLPQPPDYYGFHEASWTGVYPAGLARAPMDVSASIRDASAVALQAIPAGERG